MRSGFSSCRARLVASVTALLGLSAASGCAPRSVTDVDRVSRPVVTPQPVASQQPVIIQQPQEVFTTTQAIGEEDSVYQTPPSNVVTTLAVGEEDGTGPIPVEPNGGIGNGAGSIPIDPRTLQEVGNVQGDFERVFIPPAPATTLVIGEEG